VVGTENLSTSHPFFKALNSRTVGVPFDSIIATDSDPDFLHGDDRIVPYASSHLAGAKSEVLVPYWDGCVEKPETVNAVMGIEKTN
jgi:hypothetical protein